MVKISELLEEIARLKDINHVFGKAIAEAIYESNKDIRKWKNVERAKYIRDILETALAKAKEK